MGNLGSVENAFRFLQRDARIINSPADFAKCKALVLPGVGAFGDCMLRLNADGFTPALRSWIASGKPLLGICLGMQVLFEESMESPRVAGLGVFAGKVNKFLPVGGLKVPQIGWNQVRFTLPDCPDFKGVADNSFFYFVHSYHIATDDKGIVAGITNYGIDYPSIIWKKNVIAFQFHPEKSHHAGLQLLRSFAEWVEVQ